MCRLNAFLFSGLLLYGAAVSASEATWLDRHRLREPAVEESGVCIGTLGDLPEFTITPEHTGRRLVRVSLPFAPGALPAGMGLTAHCNGRSAAADLRILTRHQGKPASVRRGMITFAFPFDSTAPHMFKLLLTDRLPGRTLLIDTEAKESGFALNTRLGKVRLDPDRIVADLTNIGAWEARLIAPDKALLTKPELEIVESGRFFLWVRLLAPDPVWPRIIEIRLDALGGVALWAHIQRLESGNATADDLGWTVLGLAPEDVPRHTFSGGLPTMVSARGGTVTVRFPRAHFERRGHVEALDGSIRFLRCETSEQVAFQEAAWRSAAIAIDPAGHPERNPLMEYASDIQIAPEHFDAIYQCGKPLSAPGYPVIDRLCRFTRHALTRAMAVGDDFGNVTSYHANREHGAVYGMNRLNHCPPVFFEAWRSGDTALRDVAALWCENMHALSLWWGSGDAFGGTRYNNAAAQGQTEHADDPHFMWRTNDASSFCTKGFDSFFLAYEETGDPRMTVALEAQVNYAQKHIFVDRGEARNIGDAADFMALYRYTGLSLYLDEAVRLFEELRLCVGEDYLFSQSGRPIISDLPFIDDDARGYSTPFGKPYIMGYALAGLPALLETRPDTQALIEVVRAVAAFQAESQDPLGGWRYPHPQSSSMIVDQGMEHSAQLVRAAKALKQRGEHAGELLDAVERALRARVLGYLRSGGVLSGLGGWEAGSGLLDDKNIYDLYAKPADRDSSRDYLQGAINLDYASPEGLAHFFETLQFYMEKRPVERLFHAHGPLEKVIARMPERGFSLNLSDDMSGVQCSFEENAIAHLGLDFPDEPVFSDFKLRHASDSGREAVVIKENEAMAVTMAYNVFPDFVEWSCTFVPKHPGIAALTMIELAAGFTESALKDSLQAYPGQEAQEPAGRQLPGPLLLAADLKDTTRVVGLLVPDVLAWELVADKSADYAVRIHLPLRGDGSVTLRGFLVVDHSRDSLRAFFHRVGDTLSTRLAHPAAQVSETVAYGMRAMLPAFHEARIRRMDYPLAWRHAELDFAAWRRKAREAYITSLQTPPPCAPFAPKVLAVEDRGAYEARKLAFNISADERAAAYLLVPEGEGPFPAMLALHDHGAHFTIGKEKVVRPFGVSRERLDDAQAWADQYYGGRFIGDELAARGYVVFATDALFWGDRGRHEGPLHRAQQELAANILQLGQSWAGIITWDDMRCAVFLQGLPEVDPERIGCIGLSMGAHRTWNLCAATDIVKAGAAICWLGDTAALLGEGNNQTTGQSAFSMLHPGLRNLLDFPDVASIACPKPMLYYNGAEDALFPVSGVEACYRLLQQIYEDQEVEHLLETRLWEVPHLFNEDMQLAAFAWLDTHLRTR